MNTISFFEETVRNVRFSIRALRKSPTFAATAILSIAIGIGANTAVFSVVDGVLLKPLAFPESDRLVSIKHVAPGIGGVVAETGLNLSSGIVQAIQQVNASGPRGGDADAESAGELRVRTSHKSRRLFMANVDKANPVFLLAESLEDTVDPVSGQTKDGVNSPCDESLYEYIRRVGHFCLPRRNALVGLNIGLDADSNGGVC
jgi:hypothetical protein